jgi:hypothetical protein
MKLQNVVSLQKHIVFNGLHPVALEARKMKAMGLSLSPISDATNDRMMKFRFNNGYGASVIKSFASWNNWELAVVKFEPLPNNRLPKSKRIRKKYFKRYSDYSLLYNTPVTDDVERYADNDLNRLNEDLNRIKHFQAGQY